MTKTILLVDDETYILQSLKRLFTEEGYHVLTATSGPEGMELLKNNSIQVIISDQRMPLMKGSEFLKQVKELYPDTLRMILTAYIDFDAIKEAINEGAIYKFISKPWQDSVLLQYVHDAFEISAKKKNSHQSPSQTVYRDVITDLHNRFSFYESLWKLIISAEKEQSHFAIVYFDIDRFGNINSLLGQKNGDRVLQRLAKRLKKIIKEDQNLARVGNDEFVVAVTDIKELSNLTFVIKTLYATIKKPMEINGKKLYLTASIGVSVYPEHGSSADLLMRHAGVALLHAKSLGGDQYQQYSPHLDKSDETQLFLEADLFQALEKDQFIIYYQPIYNIDQTKIVSVEALIRWQHPELGLLLPDKFLQFCEESNLIIPIGAWVLQTASQQIKRWHNLGLSDLALAVNLSVRQFSHPKLLDLIIDVLETTQLPPNCLELEITETLIMQNIEKVIPLLISLRGLGVHLALDDFGTGYSSLSYLRQFPFTHLKIDKSFINDMANAQNGTAIVETIISLGRILGLKVIAEGVETKDQLALLQENHCDFIQGYIFSKPLPGDEVERLLLKQIA